LVPDKGYFTTAVVDPVSGAAAEKAGMQNGDLITSIQGVPVRGYEDVISYFQKLKSDAPVRIAVRRSNEEQILSVKPRYFLAGERYAIGVRPSIQKAALAQSVSHTEDWMKSVRGGIRIGDQVIEAQTKDGFVEYKMIRNGEKLSLKLPITELHKKKVGKICRFSLREKLIRYPVQESLWKAFPRVKTELEEVYLFLGRLFTGKMSVDMIGGPIRIFEVTYIVGTIKGLGYFLLLFAKIGFTLAVINFLPFPVLDGGHAVFLLYEIIFRRPAPAALVRILHTLGFVALILLFAFVITNDLRSIITRLF
ncbi:MAG: site-2 protease family protein, partial [Spirochaetia bacterium]|nr:site-2 protease family protein [Spirochaetia bacterium]